MKKVLFLCFLSVTVLAGCTKTPDYNNNTNSNTNTNSNNNNNTNNNNNNTSTSQVVIKNMQFDPTTITISKGTTVQWENKDNIAHTVTADDKSFDSGNLAAGAEFSHTFNSAGTFSYHCNYHSNMKASVIVQ